MEMEAISLMRISFSLFMAILFIQSGLDKVFNWEGEKSYYHSHFAKTFLRNFVNLLMLVITVMELSAGFLSASGLIYYLWTGNSDLACWGMIFSVSSILMLFLGQRVAKDYAGAATLVIYFLAASTGLYFYLV